MSCSKTEPMNHHAPPVAYKPEQSWIPHLILALVVLAGILPFSSRAIYIDEHIFLLLAESALENPLFPSDVPALAFGVRHDDWASHTHPPVGEYYLALLTWLLPGFSEAGYRLLFAVFPITAVIAFYRIAQRFTTTPLVVSLLFAFSPAFFVMSPTIMMDVPMLAFLLAGFALFFDHRDGVTRRLVPAAACFTLAVGTGYTALVPIGCLFVWALTRPRVRELLAIALAPAALALWLLAMTVHFGRFPLLETVGFYALQPHSILANIAATFSFLGGVSLFPWSFWLLTDTARGKWPAVTISAVVAAGLLTLFLDLPSETYRWWFVLLASSGIAMLVVVVRSAWTQVMRRDGERLLMLGWASTTLVFFIVVGEMISARYLLLAMPPVYLLLFPRPARNRAVVVGTLSLLLSIGIALADFRFVNSYRSWVTRQVVPLQAQGFRVWGAAEAGLRFYLEREGIETLAADDLEPVGGDLIVRDMFGYGLAEELSALLVPVENSELTDDFPIRTFNSESSAGFHDSRFGLVPYTWSRAPYDRLQISQLSPLVEELPQPEVMSRSAAAWSPQGVILVQTEEQLRIPFRSPQDTRLQFEMEGNGRADMRNDFIELTRLGPDPVVWRNFRVVPEAFSSN